MARAKQPVTINGIAFDALIDEVRTFEAAVPEYAVENGYSISDSIILSPERLAMTLFVTNTPVTWYNRHGGNPNRVKEVLQKLEELYFAREPVEVVTTDATYTNMAIESLTISKNFDAGYAREIPISLKKIHITKVNTTTIPDSYGKSGKTGAAGGSANTQSGSTKPRAANEKNIERGSNEKSGSLLWNAAKSARLLQ